MIKVIHVIPSKSQPIQYHFFINGHLAPEVIGISANEDGNFILTLSSEIVQLDTSAVRNQSQEELNNLPLRNLTLNSNIAQLDFSGEIKLSDDSLQKINNYPHSLEDKITKIKSIGSSVRNIFTILLQADDTANNQFINYQLYSNDQILNEFKTRTFLQEGIISALTRLESNLPCTITEYLTDLNAFLFTNLTSFWSD